MSAFNIDVKIQAKFQVPKLIPVEENLFITVAMNIFRQTMLMTSHNGTGVIKILVDVSPNLNNLIVDFVSSELTTRKDVNLAIKNLVIQKDFKSILKIAEVDPYLKIAKILSNKLGWRLEFDFHQDYKFRLIIPINFSLSSPVQDEAHS